MIVEVATFRLGAGTDDGAFLALDRRVQRELVPNQPGFLRRTTAGRGGEWVVLTLWASEDDAVAFAAHTVEDPIWTAFVAALAEGSYQVRHFDTLD